MIAQFNLALVKNIVLGIFEHPSEPSHVPRSY